MAALLGEAKAKAEVEDGLSEGPELAAVSAILVEALASVVVTETESVDAIAVAPGLKEVVVKEQERTRSLASVSQNDPSQHLLL